MKLFRLLSKWIHRGSPNYIRKSAHCYWVRNQNGLHNALYECVGLDKYRTKKDVRQMVRSWPKSYPATIVINDLSFECSKIYIETL